MTKTIFRVLFVAFLVLFPLSNAKGTTAAPDTRLPPLYPGPGRGAILSTEPPPGLRGIELHRSWPWQGRLLCIAHPDARWAGHNLQTAYCSPNESVCASWMLGKSKGVKCLSNILLPVVP